MFVTLNRDMYKQFSLVQKEREEKEKEIQEETMPMLINTGMLIKDLRQKITILVHTFFERERMDRPTSKIN